MTQIFTTGAIDVKSNVMVLLQNHRVATFLDEVNMALYKWSYVTQHIKRYQLREDSILSYRGAKSKHILKYDPTLNSEVSHILESSMFAL